MVDDSLEQRLLTRWERHLAFVRDTLPAFAELYSRRPTSVEPYADVLRLSGFRIPPSFAAALELGIVCIPGVRELGIGVSLCSPPAIFDNHIHALMERGAGVAQGGSWLVFATEHGDLEPAYVFDKRFVSDAGEIEVGSYHQDIVCTDPITAAEHLERSAPSYLDWFSDRLDEVEAAMKNESGREAIEEVVSEWQARPVSTYEPPTWEELWGGNEATDGWTKRYWRSYRRVLRETTDAEVAEAIGARVDRELAGKGPRIVPGLSGDLERGSWTNGMPGPADLAMRLPASGPGSVLELLWFTLRHCGVEPRSDATGVAWAELERRRQEGGAGDPAVRHACADEGWAFELEPGEAPGQLFAQALAWSLGPLDHARVHHVLTTANSIRFRVAGDRKLGLHRIWSRLRRIQRGEVVAEHLVAPKPALGETLESLSAWFDAFEGSQRDLLAALGQRWESQLAALEGDQAQAAARLIRKKISSKKLRAARDELLARLSR